MATLAEFERRARHVSAGDFATALAEFRAGVAPSRIDRANGWPDGTTRALVRAAWADEKELGVRW